MREEHEKKDGEKGEVEVRVGDKRTTSGEWRMKRSSGGVEDGERSKWRSG